MPKPKIPMDDDYDIDMSSPAAVLAKLPGNIAGNLKPLSSYMEIPCDKLIEYQDKRDFDFQPWPEGKFELLVESIRSVGVLEAITVRPAKIRKASTRYLLVNTVGRVVKLPANPQYLPKSS